MWPHRSCDYRGMGALNAHPLDHRLDLLGSGLPPSSERGEERGKQEKQKVFMRQRSHVSSLKRAVVAMATCLLLLLFWDTENDFSCGWLLEAQSPFSIPHSPKRSAIVTSATDAQPTLQSTNGKPSLNGCIVELHHSQRALNKTLLNNYFKLTVENNQCHLYWYWHNPGRIGFSGERRWSSPLNLTMERSSKYTLSWAKLCLIGRVDIEVTIMGWGGGASRRMGRVLFFRSWIYQLVGCSQDVL